MLAWVLSAALLAAAACATPPRSEAPAAAPVSAFSAKELRHPAILVRVAIRAGAGESRERERLIDAYEGALLDGLDQRGVPPRDVQRAPDGLDTRGVLARGREVGADHVIVVDVTVDRASRLFCRGGRRPFEVMTTVWAQQAEILRTADGAHRLSVGGPTVAVTDIEANCDDPRASRRRDGPETIREAVSRLLARLLGS
jgi:hypothetical protein